MTEAITPRSFEETSPPINTAVDSDPRLYIYLEPDKRSLEEIDEFFVEVEDLVKSPVYLSERVIGIPAARLASFEEIYPHVDDEYAQELAMQSIRTYLEGRKIPPLELEVPRLETIEYQEEELLVAQFLGGKNSDRVKNFKNRAMRDIASSVTDHYLALMTPGEVIAQRYAPPAFKHATLPLASDSMLSLSDLPDSELAAVFVRFFPKRLSFEPQVALGRSSSEFWNISSAPAPIEQPTLFERMQRVAATNQSVVVRGSMPLNAEELRLAASTPNLLLDPSQADAGFYVIRYGAATPPPIGYTQVMEEIKRFPASESMPSHDDNPEPADQGETPEASDETSNSTADIANALESVGLGNHIHREEDGTVVIKNQAGETIAILRSGVTEPIPDNT